MNAVTVLTGPERRRRWAVAKKLRIVEETLAPGTTVVEVARRNDVHPNLLHVWRNQARRGELTSGLTSGDRPQFAPLVVGSASDPSGSAKSAIAGTVVEVLLRNGRVMRVPEHVVLSRVMSLADALEGQAR
jgi:transposase